MDARRGVCIHGSVMMIRGRLADFDETSSSVITENACGHLD